LVNLFIHQDLIEQSWEQYTKGAEYS